MKYYLVILFLTLGLIACSDDKESTENTENTDKNPNIAPLLNQGSYNVSVETNDELPLAGKYYSGADGTRLLILNDEQERAAVVMSYDAQKQIWQTTQHEATPISFAHTDSILDQAIDIATLAGSYTLSVPDHEYIQFEINNNGAMSSKQNNCAFVGTITSSQMNNVLNYQLQNNNCTALNNNTRGFVVIDDDFKPARFRLVSSATESKDAWAFPQE